MEADLARWVITPPKGFEFPWYATFTASIIDDIFFCTDYTARRQ